MLCNTTVTGGDYYILAGVCKRRRQCTSSQVPTPANPNATQDRTCREWGARLLAVVIWGPLTLCVPRHAPAACDQGPGRLTFRHQSLP